VSIVEVHSRLANVALLYSIAMALWGLWRYFRRQGVDSNYWGSLVIAEIVYVVQAGLGAYILLSGAGRLANTFMHVLYGVVAILVVPGVFMFTRGDDQRRSMLIYALAFLFMIGILLRSQGTGG